MTSFNFSKLLNPFARGRVHTISQVDRTPRIIPNTMLTTKKWVVTAGQVGILDQFTSPSTCIVHLVNDIGETVKMIEVGVQDVVIARLGDIPEKRRPDSAAGARLGYI